MGLGVSAALRGSRELLGRPVVIKQLPGHVRGPYLHPLQNPLLYYCAITFRTLKDNQPAYLADLILARPKCSKYLRSTNSNRFAVPRIKTKTGSRAFSIISGLALWNALPVPIRNALTFRKLLKSHLFDLAFPP